MGIVCAQQDVARVYPLPDDPERCLEDFLELAAEHARRAGERLAQQEASVERFLELSGDDFPEAGLDVPRPCAASPSSPPSSSACSSSSGISFLLARALTGPGAERSRVRRRPARPGARRRRRGARAAAGVRARARLRARVTRERVAQLQRPGKVQILNYRPSVRVTMTRRSGTAPRGVASRRVAARRAVREGAARGPADRRRGGAARDLEADRARCVLRVTGATSRRTLCCDAADAWRPQTAPAPRRRCVALALPGAAAAADKPSAKTLYYEGPSGRYLMDGDVAVPPRPGQQGPRAAAGTARRAAPAGRR